MGALKLPTDGFTTFHFYIVNENPINHHKFGPPRYTSSPFNFVMAEQNVCGDAQQFLCI